MESGVQRMAGKTKTFTTDSSEELETLWLKNNTQNNKAHHERSQAKRNKNS